MDGMWCEYSLQGPLTARVFVTTPCPGTFLPAIPNADGHWTVPDTPWTVPDDPWRILDLSLIHISEPTRLALI
eukprot:4144213-Alexandrium_andersonii.AAC.1